MNHQTQTVSNISSNTPIDDPQVATGPCTPIQNISYNTIEGQTVSNYNPYHDNIGRFTTKENHLTKTHDAVISNRVALPPGKRLEKALIESNLDIETQLAQAFIESSFQPNAQAKTSSALGLFQIINSTKDDIENRIWPKQVSKNNPLNSKKLKDWRTDPETTSAAEFIYLLDRIATAKNSLKEGLERYYGSSNKEENSQYAEKILACRSTLKEFSSKYNGDLRKALEAEPENIKLALDKARTINKK